MADAGRRGRRGPAPIASFDHDVSDESSPESKQAIRLPEIREHPASSTASAMMIESASDGLAPPEQRARSHSSPAVHSAHSTSSAPTVGSLQTPSAPRIDISRASSSSHHDSRDSSPELALFAGTDDSKNRLELGFREDGTLDLRSSTEELAFLEGAPGGSDPPRAPSVPTSSRRHSRKDSQGSEAALLGVSGRTSRLSSIGSQCSAQSALSGFSHTSRVSRLSVVSSMSRSPSPHKMLLETSFCGPKPIETDPDICAAAVEQRLLEIAKMSTETMTTGTITQPSFTFAAPVDARDRREVRTEATVENARPASAQRFTSTSPQPVTTTAPPRNPVTTVSTTSVTSPAIAPFDDDKLLKETRNKAKVEERRMKPKVRRQPSEPEVFKSSNRSKNVIRIKLKPDDEYDEDDDESERTLIGEEALRKPVTLELKDHPTQATETISPHSTPRHPRDSRTPSPTGVVVSRKSSFCSLFKSRETIASPDSPSEVLKRKKSLNEGRSRSKSRDRSTTPTSATKIKGSMLSLFKTPRRSTASPSPSSRDASPVVQPHRQFPQTPVDSTRVEKLKYYEESKDGIIHIPLRTPPEELSRKEENKDRPVSRETVRPASAPQPRGTCERPANVTVPKPAQRTVLPDGSIIIPLHSPTEKTPANCDLTESEVKTDHRTTRDSDSKPLKVEDHTLDTSSTQITESQLPAGSEPTASSDDRPKKKERLIFTTHIGSREQVFCTQFSITKTPSVTSEISESAPSFPESEDVRPSEPTPFDCESFGRELPGALDKIEGRREEREEERDRLVEGDGDERSQSPAGGGDSSGSEASGPSCGSEAERRGLVVQESFEELPYVPTTLPLERSLALPMVPVRERGAGAAVRGVQRPRARAAPLRSLGSPSPATPPGAATPGPATTPPGIVVPPPPARLHIRLPQRTRAASASEPVPQRAARPRSRSGGDADARKNSWIDFEDVPEQPKQPKRIETVPGAPASVVYVPPERCHCECHTHARGEQPLLHPDTPSSSSQECEAGAHGAPFTADLDLRNNLSDIARPQ